MDRKGRSIRREPQKGDARQYLVQRELSPIGEPAQLCAAFPKEGVTVGSRWKGDVLLALPGPRQHGEAKSTLAEIREKDGARHAVIRSEVRSKKEESHSTWQTNVDTPGTEVTGTTEGVLDIDRGIWLEMRWDLRAKFEGKVEGRGFSGVMNLKSEAKLKSVSDLPDEEAAARKAGISAFDKALSKMYGNEFDKGLEILEAQEERAKDPEWKKGLALTIALLRPLVEPPPEMVSVEGDETTPPDADVIEIYKQAGEYAKAGELQKAVAAYGEFLSVESEGVPSATRLLAQYRLAGLLEKLGQRDEALAAYRAVASTQADDDYSRSLKNKAMEKIEAGKPGPE
jgi:tetratricopeptide (TPR) repeat protein